MILTVIRAGRRAAVLPLLAAVLAAPTCAQTPRVPDAIAAGTFEYDRNAPLELRDSLESVQDGLETHAISFASPGGGRVTGLMFVPQGGGRKAGIVNMHGAPGSARQVAAGSAALARRGAVVVAIDAPFARRAGGEMVAFSEADSADHVQLVIDLQRAVDLLLSRPDVDPARIAYVGGSYGGAVGTMYAAVDPRPAAYVLFVPDGGLVSHFTAVDGSPQPPLTEMPAAQRDRWLAAMRPVEGIHYIRRAKPGSILFQNGRQDPFVTADKAAHLHRTAGASHTVRWYDSGHALPAQARIDRYDFLAERIGIAAPTDEERTAARNAPPPQQPRPTGRHGG